MESERQEQKQTCYLCWLVVFGLACGVIWFALPFFESPGKREWTSEGLFTGLAFAGALVAVWMQGREIRDQQKDFTKTLHEMQRSAGAGERLALSVLYQTQIQCQLALRALADDPEFIAKRRELTSGQNVLAACFLNPWLVSPKNIEQIANALWSVELSCADEAKRLREVMEKRENGNAST